MILRWANLGAMVALLGAGILTGCSREASQAPAADAGTPAVARIVMVERKSRPAAEEVVGAVRAKLRARIEAKISGRIERMLVTQGQTVEKGELLSELDAREIKARLDQASAQNEQAERDLVRFTQLVEQAAVTRQEFDAAQARAQVTRAALREAETMLGYASVTAPFAGVISQKLADVGDLAAPGRALVELEDPGSLRFEADVPEALIGKLRLGDTMLVRVEALQRGYDCVVSEISPVADPLTRTFGVKWDFPKAPELRSGLFGRVAVPFGETTALRIPAGALVTRGQLEIVFVAADGKALLRLVRTGKRIEDEIEILAGLSGGEQVIVSGAEQLRDGQRVEVAP